MQEISRLLTLDLVLNLSPLHECIKTCHLTKSSDTFASVTRQIRPLVGFSFPPPAVGLLTLALIQIADHVNPTTIALLFLLLVLVIATFLGTKPALFTSLLAGFSFNFFFLPPYHTLAIAEPQNWIALIVFLSVAVSVGHLSAKSRHRAEVAEKLYADLQAAFEQASHAEALKRSEKLKSALLDAVTHDIRTPLTSIKAATTMLIEEQTAIHTTLDGAGRADLLSVINEETDRLNSFVESMIDVAQLEAGVELPRKSVDPESIIVSALHRAAIVTAGHQVTIRHGTSGPDLNVAPKAIAEALFNLIENAAKYSPADSTIVVGYKRIGKSVQFFVEDSGPGIPDDEHDAIFDKFYRGDSALKGSGIGLSIVKGIVEAHGGRVWVESRHPGSRFAFELSVNA